MTVAAYKITDISTAPNSQTDKHALLSVMVDFLDSKDVLIQTQQFLMQLPKEHRLYIGLVGPNGEILEPTAYVTVAIDVQGEIEANIKNYIPKLDVKLGKGAVEKVDTDGRVTTDKSDAFLYLSTSQPLVGMKKDPTGALLP